MYLLKRKQSDGDMQPIDIQAIEQSVIIDLDADDEIICVSDEEVDKNIKEEKASDNDSMNLQYSQWERTEFKQEMRDLDSNEWDILNIKSEIKEEQINNT